MDIDNFEFTALHQVALGVAELERSAAFYRDVLGAEPIAAFDPPGLAFFALGSVRLLLEVVKAPSPSSGTLYLAVTDIAAAFRALAERGVVFASEPHLVHRDLAGDFGPRGVEEWMAFFEDPDGHSLALVSRIPASPSAATFRTEPAVEIQSYDASKLEAIVRLSLRAWAPVFASLERVMDPEVFREQHPDWLVTQRAAVEAACAEPELSVWVAVQEAQAVGFVALKLYAEDRMGEIYMIAVDPDFQRRGIATALTQHALAWFRKAGMSVAMVETGGDPGHAPARHTYEAAGFRALPLARYFKKI